MADKTLQKRSMRKAVDRVDVGVFGIPMRLSAWMKVKRSTWTGLIGLTIAQVVIGACLASVIGLAFGIPSNAFSITLLVAFSIGSAIGGPISFLLWSVLLIGVTHVIAGVIGGAWIASPDWWRALAQLWSNGGSPPAWFTWSVPAWILFWVAGAYGVSKLVDMGFEALSLSISFKAASRFSLEDKRIHEEAFEESNVSPVESRSLIDNGSDGTEALIAGSPQIVEPGVRLSKDVDLGGEPDLPSPIYSDLLDGDIDDPDVRRAMGLGDAVEAGATSFTIDRDEPQAETAPDTASGVVLPPELSEPDLPAVPEDNTAPLRRVTPPKVDALASRAMSKKLQQLLSSFEMALFQNEDESFIRDNQDELAIISEEQKAMLRAMDNSGPLLSAIIAVQRERASEFMMGRADPPQESVSSSSISNEASADVSTPMAENAPADTLEDASSSPSEDAETEADADDDGESVVMADTVAAMGSIFSGFARRTRTAPAADVTDDVPSEAGNAEISVADPIEAEKTAPEPARKAAPPVKSVNGFIIPRPPGEEVEEDAEPETIVSEAAAPDLESLPEQQEVVADKLDGDLPDHAGDDDSETEQPGTISSVDADGKVVVFEMAIEEEAENDAVLQSDSAEVEDAQAQVEEDEMSALVFSRLICRQVIGLVTGPLAPFEKANDVLEFERENPGLSVAQILNSRSFDEHVGSADAVAARHVWRDIQRILSQSSVERLVADLERLNKRGQDMVEEPHRLTSPAFYAFESDCTRMRTSASANNETITATVPLLQRNYEILEALRELKKSREEAQLSPATGTASTVVRQRVPAGDDVEASRGRGLLGSVLAGARKGGDLLRPHEKQQDVVDQDTAVMADDASDPSFVTPTEEDSPVAESAPVYGDENYASPHPIGTPQYDLDMELHSVALRGRQRIAQQAAARAAEEARIAQEKIDKEERERQAEIDRVENARRAEQDAAREKERLEILRRDQAYIEAERERVAAEARAAEASAAREAEAAREARERAEREARENARSLEDERILEEHRKRMDGHSLPARFRQRGIPSRFDRLTDLRDQRKTFYTLSMRDRISGLDSAPEAIASPAKRSSMMMDVMIGMEASAIYEDLLVILDPPVPDDSEAVRNLVSENSEERKFVISIQDAISTGRASERALADADMRLVKMQQAMSEMEGVSALREDLTRIGSDLQMAQEREQNLKRELEAEADRVKLAQEERDRLNRELLSLKKQMSGVIDDDFQRLLEKYATPVADAPINGAFVMSTASQSHVFLIVTTSPDSLPGGVVRVGDRSLPISDVIQKIFDRSSDYMTDSMDAFFTDVRTKSMADDKSKRYTTTLIERSITAFNGIAEAAEIQIDPADLEKGE